MKHKLNLQCLIEYKLTMFWRWLFCLLEACVEKCKDCTRLYSLKDKCPKNILPEYRFDSLNGYHEWIFRRNVIELDLNKHLRFFCCSVYVGLWKYYTFSVTDGTFAWVFLMMT